MMTMMTRPCIRVRTWRPNVLSLLAAVVLAGCGSDDPSGPGDAGNGDETGEGMSQVEAVIDGGTWSATQMVDVHMPERYAFTADDSTWRVVVRVNGFGGPDTYPLSADPDVNIQIVRFDGTGVWGGVSAGGDGTITVESYDATRVTGTFEGELPASAGSGIQTPLVVSDGSFDIRR